PTVGPVHRDAGRSRTRRRRPTLLDFQGAAIDFQNLASVLNVIVNIPCAIRYGKLGTTAEIDRPGHLSVRCLDRGRAIAVAIEYEDARRGGIENNRVGFLSNRNLGHRSQRLQIENRNRRGLSVAHESASQLWRDG